MTGEQKAARQRGPNGRHLAAAPDAPVAASAAEQSMSSAIIPIDDATSPLEIYLLRHADAGNSALWTGVDAERPLSKKGRRQAKALARTLKDLDLKVDAVISSPLIRAAQTAKPVAKAIGLEVLTDERLGYGFGRRELVAIMKQLGTGINRVVLVGHDPGFTEVVSFLVGADITMAKGALARIDLADREVKAGAGALRWLLPPDAVAR